MAKLNQNNRLKFEDLFEMESGYVMDFSNRSFKDFVYKAIDINIFNDTYLGSSGSKANRLRKLWEVESNSVVAKLNLKLLEYWKSKNVNVGFELNDLYAECIRICELLKQNSPELDSPQQEAPQPETPQPEAPQPEAPQPEAPQPETPKPEAPQPEIPQPETPIPSTPVQDLPKPDSRKKDTFRQVSSLSQDSRSDHKVASKSEFEDRAFETLAKLIQESIENNEPEKALNKLYSFVGKYIKGLCNKHNISYDENEPLIIFYGDYIKRLRAKNKIESEMTERILSSSISVLEVFNKEWNSLKNKKILNYNESLLILKSIAGIIDFIESIEND